MNSRLRNKIRKTEPKPHKLSQPNDENRQTQAQQQRQIATRKFGQPLNTCLQNHSAQPGATKTINQLKAKALERKKKSKASRKLETKPCPQIQTDELSNVVPTTVQNQNLETEYYLKSPSSCQQVNSYIPDICRYLYIKDMNMPIVGDIFANNQEVNEKMRFTLVDWIIKIHYRFHLEPRTLFRCISILDSFTKCSQVVKKRNYQLIGVTCLYIACKLEQIYPPANESFVNVSGKLYTMGDIFEMEGIILKQTEFNIYMPTLENHAERLALIIGLCEDDIQMSRYLMELSILSIRFSEYSPLTVAGSIMLFIKKLFQRKEYENMLPPIDLDWSKAEDCRLQFMDFVMDPPKLLEQTILRAKYETEVDRIRLTLKL